MYCKVVKNEHGHSCDFFVAGIRIGSASTAKLKETDDLIHGFSVVPKFRGMGFGKAIFADMLAHYPIRWLNVAKDNKVAITLYKSFGFRIVGTVAVCGKVLWRMERCL